MSSARGVRLEMLPAANAIGNITASSAMTVRPPSARARFRRAPNGRARSGGRSRGRRSSGRRTCRPRRPTPSTTGTAALKKMSDSMSAPVVASTRKSVDARTRSRSGPIEKAERGHPVVVERLGRGVADELIRDRRGRQRLPRVEGAAHGRGEIGRRDAGDVRRVVHEIADRRLRPLERHRAPVHRDAELQVRERRAGRRERQQRARARPRSRASLRPLPRARGRAVRNRRARAAAARDRRARSASPRRRRAETPDGVTTQPAADGHDRGTRPGSARRDTARPARARRERRRRADRWRTPARRRRCCGSAPSSPPGTTNSVVDPNEPLR